MRYQTISVVCKKLEYIVCKSNIEDKIIIYNVYWVLHYVSIFKHCIHTISFILTRILGGQYVSILF